MSPNDRLAVAIVFVIACVWFTSMLKILINQLDIVAEQLRGINAKLGRIETRGTQI
jgi:hypothetical protein